MNKKIFECVDVYCPITGRMESVIREIDQKKKVREKKQEAPELLMNRFKI